MLPMQGACVPSLVRGLGSHILHSAAKKKNLSGIIGHYAHPDMMDYEVYSATYEVFLPKRPYQGIKSNLQHMEHLKAKETS